SRRSATRRRTCRSARRPRRKRSTRRSNTCDGIHAPRRARRSPAPEASPVDERLFARLAARLADEPVVVASVVATQGAVPRHRGARMLITREDSEASVGGGMAEARVVAAARTLLDDAAAQR